MNDPSGKRSIWRQRGRRFALGLNVGLASLLAVILAVLFNVLAQHYYWRWDVSGAGTWTVSDKSRSVLGALQEDVRVVAFFQRHHALYDHVRNLLREFEYAARPAPGRLEVEFVDPDRELARTRELAERYDVSDVNVVVFDAAGRRKYVEAGDIVEYDVDLAGLLTTGRARRRLTAIRAEQAFCSALLNVTQAARPVVYWLSGHGERGMDDFNEQTGYSAIARIMRRDNIELRVLLPAETHGIPEECATLLIFGADRRISEPERDMIGAYLDRSGRVMVLSDAGADGGLESLLLRWGVVLGQDVVVDPQRTLTGREVFVTEYADHPVTRGLDGVGTVFYMPRSVTAAAGFDEQAGDGAADRPRVSELALCSPEGWAEANLKVSPARFDPGVDRRGPVSVAAAVEKGRIRGLEIEIRPTRLVVIGDSDFVSNGALRSGVGGNEDFFMNGLNWLLERETLLAVAPRVPGALDLGLDRRGVRRVFLILTFGAPALAILAGLAVWWRRRR
ncbi:MAG: GldG family protein [Lentisphaerae bacterium]|nr:GldG family protein [Lentisphaerota bacterium]